jgi:hypothetical protein
VRALLTPEIAPRLGVVLFRPGSELMPLFHQQRVLIETVPENLRAAPSGMLPPARQPLVESETLAPFFADPLVHKAAGGLSALDRYVMGVSGCQWPHSDYHHHEYTVLRYAGGAVRLCWHCDNRLRDQQPRELAALALRNRAEWIIDAARVALGFGTDHSLTLPELCWWAVVDEVAGALPESAARAAMRWPALKVGGGPRKESDLAPVAAATDVLQKKVQRAGAVRFRPCEEPQEEHKAVLALGADPEAPESFMLRPKRRRWENKPYTDWVKTRPCSGCGRPADDPHHIIGNGMGGTATKTHDLFVIPLCRACHDKLHADVAAFEREHGTQLELLFRFLDWALGVGVIVKA